MEVFNFSRIYNLGYTHTISLWMQFNDPHQSDEFEAYITIISDDIWQFDRRGMIKILGGLGITKETINRNITVRKFMYHLTWHRQDIDILIDLMLEMGFKPAMVPQTLQCKMPIDVTKAPNWDLTHMRKYNQQTIKSYGAFLKYVDIDTPDAVRRTSLYNCAITGDQYVAEQLMQLGAKIHKTGIAYKNMPTWMQDKVNKHANNIIQAYMIPILGIGKYRRLYGFDKNLFIKIAKIIFHHPSLRI
jgi:hypothetical protein